MSDGQLRGLILGFEEYKNYSLEAVFGESSPFRLLTCSDAPLSFAVVNPYHIVDDYSFEIDDMVLRDLFGNDNYTEEIAVLCMVRANDNALYVNLRSPIIFNIRKGIFAQTILQSETYGVSVPFIVKKAG